MKTAHVDTFVLENLPPREQWPELTYPLPELAYPPVLNCAAALLDPQLEGSRGAREALRGAGGSLTYEALAARVNRLARVLVEDLGVVPGNRVLLHGGNTPTMACLWLAAARVGAVVVATMPLLRARELAQVIDKARVSHALTDARLLEVVREACGDKPFVRSITTFHATGRDALETLEAQKSPRFDAVPTSADDPVLIAFTSGTTGEPKGTVHTHRDVMVVCDCFPRSILEAREDDVFIGSPPLAFTFGLGGLLLFPLRVGATAVLLESLGPEPLLRAIEQHRATVCFTAPTSYRLMAPHTERFDLRSLRKCVSAGEILPAATRALWKQRTGIEPIDGIGSTEMLHIFISHREDEARPGATGRAIAGYRACVMDDAGNPVPNGTPGRLAVKGPTGCRYLADARQRAYVRDGWNYTGDAATLDDDGYVSILSRTDDLIISSGYNIAGPEVESALLAHPAVAECAVVGVLDDERGQVVTAFVVLRDGHEGTEALTRALQEHVKSAIAPYKYPRVIEYCASLPRTETGKLQRFRLRDEANARRTKGTP